jgi:hypothetical protein
MRSTRPGCCFPRNRDGPELGRTHTSSTRAWSALLASLCLCVAPGGVARAADVSEFWPEANLFYGLSPRTRLYLDAAYAEGKESDERSMDLGAYLDVSLKPIKRRELWDEDWQRSRYFWARVGYDRIFKATGESGSDVAEDRGVVSLYGKAPLPAEVWLEVRARADLRWIDDEYSTRYRARLEATREFRVLDHTVVPYINYEWLFLTRATTHGRVLLRRRARKSLSASTSASRHISPARRTSSHMTKASSRSGCLPSGITETR